ncbi:PP2C family protein-serine/threonine phosphatase [Desulfonatronum lacustre]|uniref:PP2C family protein-serine/threonine phosphatase n=1 Tax=Desulfonatronum lacustre TaxID=66849 RepID=UPI00048FA1EA|nr:PP2C family protein-serine/threonine phosphatase [Desulfonatronum lacustre]
METSSTAHQQSMKYAEDISRLYHLERQRAEDLRLGALMQKRFLTPVEQVPGFFAPTAYEALVYNAAPMSVSGDFFCLKPMGGQLPEDEGPRTETEAATGLKSEADLGHNFRPAGFLLADSCGHGLSAALISMRISSLVQTCPAPLSAPEELIRSIDQDICGLMPPGRFVAASYAILHPDRCLLSNAGLPFPIHVQNDRVEEIAVSGPPMGMACGNVFRSVEREIRPGDLLVMFTDGLTEAGNGEDAPYGVDRLKICLAQHGRHPLHELMAAILTDLRAYIGNLPLDDDVTVALFRAKTD